MFEKDKNYTIYQISEFLANTTVARIKVVDVLENGDAVFVRRNHKGNLGRKKFILKLRYEYYSGNWREFKGAVFEGWDQAVKADSETGSWRGNACYNFIGSKDEVRAWIEEGQLNEKFDREKVLAVSASVGADNKEELVFADEYQGGQAVLDRVLANS